MQALAAGLLVLALAAIAVTVAANNKWVAIQGPVALQAVGKDTVWLGVDEDLWVLDRAGHRTGQHGARELGFTEAVGAIALAPEGQALLASRHDREWRLVDRATLKVVRSIRPQWPEDIAKLPMNAVHLAVSPEGDIAAATGGGHTVLLFDRDGRLLARTAPDTYLFTNGLWWSPDGWWTTDTNRFALHLLDARTLDKKRTVLLRPDPWKTPFLGEAMASEGGPAPGGTLRPMATVSRLGDLMAPGHAVDVYADGSQVLFNLDTIAQLRDLAWFDGHLLMVDGDRFEVRRYNADHVEVGTFGDEQVHADLARLHEDRAFWHRLASRQMVLLAALLLALAIGAHARQRQLAVQPQAEEADNEPAIEWLRAPGEFDRVRLESEVPREALYLPGRVPRWLLVTNRRILLFVGKPGERRLASEWPRRGVVFAGAPADIPARRSVWQQLLRPANLALTFTTGTTVYLRCASEAAGRRVAQLLMSSPALPGEGGSIQVPLAPRQRWPEVLASFVVPGSGQWLQGRFAIGTVLFTAALLLCAFGWAPVLWALHGPKMEVSRHSITIAFMAWLLVPLIASGDAWRFGATRRS
jgi:hypothetical protein